MAEPSQTRKKNEKNEIEIKCELEVLSAPQPSGCAVRLPALAAISAAVPVMAIPPLSWKSGREATHSLFSRSSTPGVVEPGPNGSAKRHASK